MCNFDFHFLLMISKSKFNTLNFVHSSVAIVIPAILHTITFWEQRSSESSIC